MQLSNKTIIITDSNNFIGKYLAHEFALRKANLILTHAKDSKLEKYSQVTKDRISSIHIVDFTEDNSIKTFIENIKTTYNHIDILINNAGFQIYKNLEDTIDSDFYNSFNINIKAPYILSRELLPMLRQSESSRIINLISEKVNNSTVGKSLYLSSKFALQGFSSSLNDELKDTTDPAVSLITLMDNGNNLLSNLDINQALTPEFVAKNIIDKIEDNTLPEDLKI